MQGTHVLLQLPCLRGLIEVWTEISKLIAVVSLSHSIPSLTGSLLAFSLVLLIFFRALFFSLLTSLLVQWFRNRWA